jgi:thermostable hemolysin
MRGPVENAIRASYWKHFKARLSAFPPMLAASIDSNGAVEAAAAFRFSEQGFFSECYLDIPVEGALRHRLGHVVDRGRVVEICNLIAKQPSCLMQFVADLIEFIEFVDADWAVFTATRPLRTILERRGLKMSELARADRARIAHPSDWGCYYEHDPRVMAVHRGAVLGSRRRLPGEGIAAYAHA